MTISEQCMIAYERMNMRNQRPRYFVMSAEDLLNLRKENSLYLTRVTVSRDKYTFMVIEIALRTSNTGGVEAV